MKSKLILCLIFLAFLFVLPLLALGAGSDASSGSSSLPSPSSVPTAASASSASSQSALSPAARIIDDLNTIGSTWETEWLPNWKASLSSASDISPVQAGNGQFQMLDEATGEILTVSDRDFLYGAIATEMSPLSEEEALKAQGVAAYTYYSRLREQQEVKPTASLQGADFTVDTEKWLIYTTKEQMQERWGSNFEKYWSILENVVQAVYGKTIQYEGELITATYYAISSGKTENAADVWGGKTPYLVSVDSPGDTYASGYQTTVTVPEDEFQQKALAQWEDCDFSKEAQNWIGSATYTEAGSVKTMEIGGVLCKGSDVRTVYGLRSTHFTCTYEEGSFTFTVKGYGHGVGMSQMGADYMAQQGSTYEEILAWYYPGTQIVG